MLPYKTVILTSTNSVDASLQNNEMLLHVAQLCSTVVILTDLFISYIYM